MNSQTRWAVIACAENWIDTPYQHQASCRGHGTDCLGLIRGVWRELYGQEPQCPPPYTPDWAEVSGEETLLKAAQQWLIPVKSAQPGDVVLFRMLPDAPCKHVAILAARDTLIHAYWARAVVRSHYGTYWRNRTVAAFSFPSIGPNIGPSIGAST